MDKLLIEDKSAVESDGEGKNKNSSDSEFQKPNDSEFEDIEMEDFIANESDSKSESENSEKSNDKIPTNPKNSIEDFGSLPQPDYVEANKNRTFRKLKKIASENLADGDNKGNEDFIVDDIGPTDDHDDYTLEIQGPEHTSQAMTLVTSIFGDVTDFLKGNIILNKNELLKSPKNKLEKFEEKQTENDSGVLEEAGEKGKPRKNLVDVPKRLNFNGKQFDELFIAKEAKFILDNYFKEKGPIFEEKIQKVLHFFHKDHFEVPYIALYQPNIFYQQNEKTIWDLLKYDISYRNFSEKLFKTKKLIENLLSKHKSNLTKILKIDIFCDKLATNQKDLEDLFLYVRFLTKISITDDGQTHFLDHFVKFYEGNNVSNFSTLRERVLSKNDEKDQKITKKDENDKKLTKKDGKNLKRFKKTFFEMDLKTLRCIQMLGFSFTKFDKLREKLEIEDFDEIQFDQNLDEANFLENLANCSKGENSRFSSISDVENFIIKFLSTEIGKNPFFKKISRKIFLDNAELSTIPTKKGKRNINWMNPLFTIKKLTKKPISQFFDEFENPSSHSEAMLEQYALLTDALERGYIKREFSFKDDLDQSRKYGQLEKTLLSIYSEPLSESQKVTELRSQIVLKAIETHFLPDCIAFADDLLLEKSQNFIAANCSKALYEEYLVRERLWKNDFGGSVIAIALCDGEEPSCCAVLDQNGLLMDYAIFRFLKFAQSSGKNAKKDQNVRILKKKEDLKTFKELILEHSPDLVVIGASHFRCDKVLSDIESVCSVSEKRISCELVKPQIAKIFERSSRAENEFFGYPAGIRNAVSLGRFAIDPLSEICYMTFGDLSEQNDILSLKLDKDFKLVPKMKLMERLTETLVSFVNRVGVELSKGVLEHPHKKAVLQFVSGLSPKMAELIAKKSKNGIQSRAELFGIISGFPKIYQNCVGFLRLSSSEQKEMNRINLGETRIKPDLLPLTEKILKFALREANVDFAEKTKVEKLAKMAKKNLKAILNFDCEKCLKEFMSGDNEENGFGEENLKYFINLIIDEIKNPFQVGELKEYKKLSDEELFWLITCESPQTLHPGQLLAATVVAHTNKSVLCQLDCNVLGVIKFEHLLSWDDLNTSEDKISVIKRKVPVGTTIKARVVDFSKEKGKFSIFLNALKDCVEDKSLENPEKLYLPKRLDRYLDTKEEKEESEDEKESKKPTFVARKIDFPFFKNVTRVEAENYLRDKETGSLVIRPSTRGPNFLTATWKIFKDPFICANIEIKEKNKPNSFSVGRLLEISNLQFEDLDEIYARFFEKMTARINEVIKFKSFRFGTEKNVEEMVAAEKRDDPSRIPYGIGLSQKHPGCLIIFYIFNVNVKKEYIIVVPNGLKFRNKVFKSADRLVSWFKSHPYENSPYVKRKSAPKNYNRNEHSRNHDRDDGYNNRRANFRNRVDFDSRNSSQRYQQPNRYYSGNKNFDDDSHRNFTKRNYENVNRNFGRNEKNFDNRRFENSHKNVKQSPRYQEPQHQFSRPSPRGYSNRPQNESKNYGDYKRPQNRSHIEKSNYGRRGNYDRRGNNFGHNNSEGYGNNSYRSRTGHDNRRSERDFNDGNRNWNSQKNFAKNGLSRSGDSGKFHNFVSNSPEVDFDQFDQIDNDSGRKRVRDPKRDEKNLVEVPKSDKKQKLGDSVSPEPDFAEFDKIDNDN